MTKPMGRSLDPGAAAAAAEEKEKKERDLKVGGGSCVLLVDALSSGV